MPAPQNDTGTLLSEAACFNCYGQPKIAELMALALLARAVNLSMPAPIDNSPNALLAEANCYNCVDSASPAQLMRLALLARILKAGDPAADVSAQTLITAGHCYVCSGVSLIDSMELALLALLNA